MYHAACKVEFQPFNRLYSQLTFFNFLLKKKLHTTYQVLSTQVKKLARWTVYSYLAYCSTRHIVPVLVKVFLVVHDKL